MPRCTVYLTEENSNFIAVVKEKFGSVSKVVQVSLEKLQNERLKEYYQQKSETYPELHKAQAEVIRDQEKAERK